MRNITYLGQAATVKCPQTRNNLQISYVDLDPESENEQFWPFIESVIRPV